MRTTTAGKKTDINSSATTECAFTDFARNVSSKYGRHITNDGNSLYTVSIRSQKFKNMRFRDVVKRNKSGRAKSLTTVFRNERARVRINVEIQNTLTDTSSFDIFNEVLPVYV